MASLKSIILGIVILQIYVHAAPSDVSKLEDIAKVEQADTKLDSEQKVIENDGNSTETQRQKRWYNPYGFGFPPISPLIYPSNDKRDENGNTGFYGEDTFTQIHRRIQEIANIVRQPPPPPPPQIPIFYPVLFIPSGDCLCNENSTPDSSSPSTLDTSETTPNINSRWPEMDDERQNWGFLINETDEDDGEDFSRPISFDPIKLNRPTRPPPPVEHGSVQADSNDKQGQTQSVAPSFQTTPIPSQTVISPQNKPQSPPSLQKNPPRGLKPPSPCESAIIACCHRPEVSYDCFANQGCSDFTSYGNPCDHNLILRVVQRFQTYYGPKAG